VKTSYSGGDPKQYATPRVFGDVVESTKTPSVIAPARRSQG